MAWPTPFWEDGRAAATPPPHPPARLLCSVPGAVEWNTAQCKRAAEPRAAPEDTGYLSDVNEALRKSPFRRLSCWSYLGPSCPDLEGWPSPAGWQISPGNGSPPGTQWQDGGRGGGSELASRGQQGVFQGHPPAVRGREFTFFPRMMQTGRWLVVQSGWLAALLKACQLHRVAYSSSFGFYGGRESVPIVNQVVEGWGVQLISTC